MVCLFSKGNFKARPLASSLKPLTLWSHKNITPMVPHANSGFKIYYCVKAQGAEKCKIYHFHVKNSINKNVCMD